MYTTSVVIWLNSDFAPGVNFRVDIDVALCSEISFRYIHRSPNFSFGGYTFDFPIY